MAAPKLAALELGASLRADGGFTCLRGGAVVIAAADEDGRLYVPCSAGRHFLDGQCDDDEVLIGLDLIEPVAE